MKNLLYIGLGGLVIYLYLKNRKKQTTITPKQQIAEAGKTAKQAVENSRFVIPDVSDAKQYKQELKQCK